MWYDDNLNLLRRLPYRPEFLCKAQRLRGKWNGKWMDGMHGISLLTVKTMELTGGG